MHIKLAWLAQSMWCFYTPNAMWIGLLLPEKRLREHSEWGALLLALVTLVHIICAGPISEHTVLHFHKRLIWIGSLSIVEMGRTSGQTKGLVFSKAGASLALFLPFHSSIQNPQQEQLIVVWRGRAMGCWVDGQLNTAPSGIWMWPKGWWMQTWETDRRRATM